VPTDPRALVVRAQLATADGKAEEAAALIEKALAAAPTDQEALYARSQLQLAATTARERRRRCRRSSKRIRTRGRPPWRSFRCWWPRATSMLRRRNSTG
jgi:GrpB-like predicted nucleotidyltransferase (UPF0157 family)